MDVKTLDSLDDFSILALMQAYQQGYKRVEIHNTTMKELVERVGVKCFWPGSLEEVYRRRSGVWLRLGC